MSDYRLDAQEKAMFELARTAQQLEQLDRRGKELTEQVRAVADQLAEVNKFLREAHVMLVRAAGLPPGVPLIGEK